MTDLAAQHVSEMLALAKAKHAEAIAAVQERPINVARVNNAAIELAHVEMLIGDCLDLTGDARLSQALLELHDQRRMLDEGIARLATKAPSPWLQPWPWISLAMLGIAVFFAVA